MSNLIRSVSAFYNLPCPAFYNQTLSLNIRVQFPAFFLYFVTRTVASLLPTQFYFWQCFLAARYAFQIEDWSYARVNIYERNCAKILRSTNCGETNPDKNTL